MSLTLIRFKDWRSIFAALLLMAGFIAQSIPVSAAAPAAGMINSTVGSSVTWNGTATGPASPDGEATCIDGTNCDTYTLNVAGAPADWSGKQIKVTIGWNLPTSDYDFYIHKDSVTGPLVTSSGEAPPVISESAIIDPSAAGTGVYVVHVVYYAASGSADQYRGTAKTENKPVVNNETVPVQSTAIAPTYDNFVPPATLGQRAGEPTIGLNWATGRAMFIASLQTLRVTFNDTVSPSTATWENKSAPNAVTSFDPILFTDSQTNRTFSSQLLPSKVSLMAFTDDDGANWTPSQGSGINSGVDHQTVGGGPYAKNADGSLKGGAVRRPGVDGKIYPNAVYYASQDIAVAEIARSDDGGLTFGAAIPMYDLTQCGGLHGHIKVAPDGTVYVPNKSCGGEQGVVVSDDNGLTWQIRTVPGSTSGRTDPSLGIGTDGTIYLGYANGDGTARVAVSTDKGRTWTDNQNVGFFAGIKNTVFPAVTAGDGDRAAFFFLGSTTGGAAGTGTDQTSPYFNGVWYGYIATTYDRGKTWVTVNATGTDPIQRGVICTNGTTCPSGTRNLLDFNDLEVDQKGRAVAAVADGCTSAACLAGNDVNSDGQLNTRFDNDGARRALILRQASGLGLFRAYDPVTTINTLTIEDDDARIAYSSGWHQITINNASANHFRFGSGSKASARLDFNVTGRDGKITYHYAMSKKGGRAELFLDGVSKGLINYKGTVGEKESPEFGYSLTFENLSEGPHSIELKNTKDTIYVDKFTLTSATSSATPFSGPGQTTSSSATINGGDTLTSVLNVEPGTSVIDVVVDSDAPITLVLIDPSGAVLATSNSIDGTATIERNVTQTGNYVIKVINLNIGAVKVFSVATPTVNR